MIHVAWGSLGWATLDPVNAGTDLPSKKTTDMEFYKNLVGKTLKEKKPITTIPETSENNQEGSIKSKNGQTATEFFKSFMTENRRRKHKAEKNVDNSLENPVNAGTDLPSKKTPTEFFKSLMSDPKNAINPEEKKELDQPVKDATQENGPREKNVNITDAQRRKAFFRNLLTEMSTRKQEAAKKNIHQSFETKKTKDQQNPAETTPLTPKISKKKTPFTKKPGVFFENPSTPRESLKITS
jgi:hypothetical protein